MVDTVPTKRDNFIWLLFALILLLFSGAILEQYGSANGATLVNLSITFTLIVAVWSMQSVRRWYHSRWGVTAIIIGLGIGDYFLDVAQLPLIHIGFILTFLITSTYIASRQVLFSGSVDFNKIVGAICIYILMGLIWAFAYIGCEILFPGSLKGFTDVAWQDNVQEAFYYSFVTLTTLGYGEITPIQPLARFLAYMEALTGQFYIAVLVASLIGVRLASISSEDAF